MENQSKLLKLTFDWYVTSYHLTKRQRQIGRRISLGPVSCVHYEYFLEDQQRTADNFFVMGAEPEAVVEQIRAFGPAEDHQIYVIVDRPGLPLAYMSLGCSTMSGVNSLMARGLEELPAPDEMVQFYNPTTPGEAMLLNAIDGVDMTLAEDVVDPFLDFYYTTDGYRQVAMARVARRKPGVGWVSHVYTAPKNRRRGLATAIMGKVLAEQCQAGDRLSLLLATENAQGMYRKLGYLEVAQVLNFVLN